MENVLALGAQKSNDMQASEKWAVSRKKLSESNRNDSVKSLENNENPNEVPKNSFSKALKQAVEKEGKDENEVLVESRSGKRTVLKTKREKNVSKEIELSVKKNQKLMLNDDSEKNRSGKAELAGAEKKSDQKTSREAVDSLNGLKTAMLAETSGNAQKEQTKKENGADKDSGEKNGNIASLSLGKNKDSRSSLRTAEGLSSRSGKVELVDLRMEKGKSGVELIPGGEKNKNGKKTGKPVVFRLDGNNASGNTLAVAETSIEVPSRFGLENDVSRTAADLARKLDEQAGGDIVKQVKVVLQKADAGEIRISLHPDNLGRVKVQIKVENHILKGQILVESAAAREAFGSALEGLKTKLIESGFSGADLELAWNGEGNSSFDEGRHNQKPMRDRNVGLENFKNMIGTMDESADAADGYVNMVV